MSFCLLFILMRSELCCHLIFVLLIIFRKCGYAFEKLLALKVLSVNKSLTWGEKKRPKSNISPSYKWKLISLIPKSADKCYQLSLTKPCVRGKE